jgi:hypothetical protein
MIRILPDSIGYNWGSTSEERSAIYPCDRYMSESDDVLFRAITVHKRKSEVFKWLCQLRVAPYSYDWIDNRGKRSPQTLIPILDEVARGQRFMEIFRLLDFTPNEHITLHIDHAAANQIFGHIVISYVVRSTSQSVTRLLVKLIIRRTTYRPFAWLAPLHPWVDLIMMRKQLLNVKRLCESTDP